MAVLCLALTFWAVRFGYIAASATIAAAVVFLLEINTATGGATMEDRLFLIVIGGGLAVVAHVALPDHALTRLRQRAGELLKTEIDYAATVVKAFVHELDHPADAMSAAWQRAFRARAAFEAASGASRMDSGELRRWLRSYRAALNAVTSSCTSLESSLPSQSPAALTPDFVAAVDDYVDALRGAPPNPALPWTVDVAALTAANQQVRERAARIAGDGAARVLVAEVATITRSLAWPSRRGGLAASPLRLDEDALGFDGDAVLVGEVTDDVGLHTLGAVDAGLGVQPAQPGGAQVTQGDGAGEARRFGHRCHLAEDVIEHQRGYSPVHVTGRTFVGRAHDEVGERRPRRVTLDHERRRDRVPDSDHRVSPRHPVAAGGVAHPERAVDLL